MRILIVDDSSTMRRIIINTLNKIGYSDYVEASNGREAVDKLAAGSIGLVITDWNMPGLDGSALAQQLRATRPDIRLILVTGYSVIMDAEAAQKRGFSEILLKPYDLRSLGEAVQRVLTLATPDQP